jgi:hypothetical protein
MFLVPDLYFKAVVCMSWGMVCRCCVRNVFERSRSQCGLTCCHNVLYMQSVLEDLSLCSACDCTDYVGDGKGFCGGLEWLSCDHLIIVRGSSCLCEDMGGHFLCCLVSLYDGVVCLHLCDSDVSVPYGLSNTVEDVIEEVRQWVRTSCP